MTQLIATQQIEQAIIDYKSLQIQIKELTAEADAIKKVITNDYFGSYEIMTRPSGLVLATYKESIRVQFEQTRFKEDHKALYETYCDLKSIRSLLIKI